MSEQYGYKSGPLSTPLMQVTTVSSQGVPGSDNVVKYPVAAPPFGMTPNPRAERQLPSEFASDN